MEQGIVTFFEVTECGFYRIRHNKTEHVEGSLGETVDLINGWLKGRDVDQTIPWSVEEHPYRPQLYCKSVFVDQKTGDGMFVFWKKFGDDSGKLSGILAKSKVDDTGIDTHKVQASVKGQKVILGEPMYYWFIPEYNLIAAVKFPNSLSDSDSVFDYIKKCIDLRINHPRKSISTRNVFNQHVGRDLVIKNVTYRSEDDSYSLSFKLNAELKELSINDASLAGLAKRITHLVVRETISSTKEVKKDSAFVMFDRLLRKSKQSKSISKQVEITSEESFSIPELRQVIAAYYDDFSDASGWDNVGFKFDGIESPTKWFNNYVDRKRILMNESDKKEASYYTAEKMLIALQKERQDLLDFMLTKKDDKFAAELAEPEERKSVSQ
ncbi:hypothetical protein [Aeromonas hydrophila]|uniref:hypothetical protein n=1 Tax=Aeromonas hydrophila TaxID=644 RepID=UPI001FC8AE92|nr:hypothetical protein [Aeromonas hydrophila]GKQ96537.1 hypothetical protein KAM461_07870 [Aeromonas hydrophila]